ncbi:MAG: response regulator [Candidatus Heimdallarchaeota archaeon]|nr:response regulator [Candidatus Heimdallarchaeota archaeon]MCK4955698.1 response regulator [Candidatus Heimdallarchaeota archaeon]
MATIYIIDDEDSIQFLYKEAFALEGHKIVGIADNGMQAIEEIDKFRKCPDIIIMDHRMPIKNGLDTLKDLQKLKAFSKSKILFITADPTVREEASKLGAALFIQKPFSILQLAKIITELNKK